MTPQEIVDSFKHERARFRRMRTDMGECISLWMAGLPIFLWDNMRAHISAYLDRMDPKRQTITDEQLRDAIPNDF